MISHRHPLIFFWLAQTLAFLLLALVFLASVLDRDLDLSDAGWPRLLVLFARDVVVRRTAVASALGLIVTACVFFQAPKAGPAPVDTPARTPGNVVGA